MNVNSKLLIGLASSLIALMPIGSWASSYNENHGSWDSSYYGYNSKLKEYKVTITNLTPGQPIAPLLVTTHKAGKPFFVVGAAPTEGLDALAEAGNGQPLADSLADSPYVRDTALGDGGTPPGNTSTVIVRGKAGDHISIGAMLGNTNDAFVGLEDVNLPTGRQAITYMAPAYDAGTESNDELCATVPGPACGGEALSPFDTGEGFVTIHNGVHGIGGLYPSVHGWLNPVAKIVIRRVK